mmetsp:Transcript_26452/g.85501  ORF Transcript_26452/g.85501 Transcript_26452/m.85501 type:complete len:206 (-) Transcript_26452:551-1168(-)
MVVLAVVGYRLRRNGSSACLSVSQSINLEGKEGRKEGRTTGATEGETIRERERGELRGRTTTSWGLCDGGGRTVNQLRVGEEDWPPSMGALCCTKVGEGAAYRTAEVAPVVLSRPERALPCEMAESESGLCIDMMEGGRGSRSFVRSFSSASSVVGRLVRRSRGSSVGRCDERKKEGGGRQGGFMYVFSCCCSFLFFLWGTWFYE